MNLKTFIKINEKSPFAKSAHSTPTLDLKRFFVNLAMYCDEALNKNNSSEFSSKLMNIMTPDFQRQNTKWSREMQISFVENVVGGLRSNIMIYFISSQDGGFCNILDGLQRLTALKAFIDGDIPLFGEYYYDDVIKGGQIGNKVVPLVIYEFPSHRAACEFYIAMNKNITHSPSDLEPAYKFLEDNAV
jgi:hypothetical protein